MLKNITLSPISKQNEENFEESKLQELSLSPEEISKFGTLASNFPLELLRTYWEKFDLKEVF